MCRPGRVLENATDELFKDENQKPSRRYLCRFFLARQNWDVRWTFYWDRRFFPDLGGLLTEVLKS